MATAQRDTLLQHIQKLAVGRAVEQQTDRELLEDFTAGRNAVAFTALVSRHGPMVLRVCRRALHHEQDAEDAFQATFLVLATHASSIRKRDTVADWLYGVAYRTAMKAKRSAARRRNHEARTPATPGPRPTWDDVQTVLDEEIHRLPQRFREAFVLCVLEGKGGPESAATLGCKEGTVKSRVHRARQLLQQQLARRGIKLAALLAALSVAEGASRASLPAALAQATIHSGLLVAAGQSAAGVISTPVAALAAGVTRAMFLTKAKIALVVLLTIGLLAGGGVWVHRALAAPREETKADPKQVTESKSHAAAQQAASVQVRGLVLNPEGQAVKDARLIFLYGSSRKYPETVWATTSARGQFAFAVDKALLDDPWYEENRNSTYVVAGADGYGCAFAKLPPGTAGAVTLRLVKDDVPIRGRLLDLQGKPIAGATVRVDDMVYFANKDDLTPWLKAVTAGEPHSDRHLMSLWSPAYGALIPPVTTAADGTFTIHGVGRERLVSLRIDGPTIVTQKIKAMTRSQETIRVPADKPVAGRSATYSGHYAAAFDLIVPPTKPVVGVVRDKATGKPLAGVTVHTRVTRGMTGIDYNLIRVTTDKDGRYRISGLPKGPGNQIAAQPADLPYLPAVTYVPDSPGLEPVKVDFALHRGVWVHGRVTDKATGKPVASGIEYFGLADNPHLAKVRLDDTNWSPTRDDGSFRIVVPPGPGILAVRSNYERYRKGVGADRIKARRAEGTFELIVTRPYLLHPGNYHVLVPVNPQPGAEAIACEVMLDPGRTLKGIVVGPDGQPLAGAHLNGANQPSRNGEFTIIALGDNESRLIQGTHDGKLLAGSLVVHGNDKEPVRLQLEPWGSVTGRLVKPDGDPMTNVWVDIGHLLRVRAGKDGKFRIDGLAHNLKYEVSVVKDPGYGLEISGKNLKDIAIKPGETRDLGDIRVKPME
jgi:RNA polymerase sigma factor (sigma-70 family)